MMQLEVQTTFNGDKELPASHADRVKQKEHFVDYQETIFL